MKKTIWSFEDIEYLKNNYLNKTYNELSDHYGLSNNVIYRKIIELGLKKNNIDKTYDMVLKTANKYKNRSDFKKYSSYMYEIASKNKWLDKICSHMIFKNPSKPQLILKDIMDHLLGEESLYNDRKIIKPYELDIFYDKWNIAFEFNGKKWHNDHDIIKRDHIKKELCEKNNIKLFVINEIGKNYEYDIKNQIKIIINEINKICSSNISFLMIDNYIVDISKQLIDYDSVMSLCKNYDIFSIWKKENSKLCNKLYKMKLIDIFTSHMKKGKKI